ncbi:MAG: hypothetical protein HY701_02020 [Gemmatimonadetes bacterium]|nr:hypothetical protein [Gemmatimonadota bacterium]
MFMGPSPGRTRAPRPVSARFVPFDFLDCPILFGLPDFRDSDVHNMIEALGELSRLDNVRTVVPGHAGLATQQSFTYFRDYENFGWLRANVITMWDYLYRYREPSKGLGPYQNSFPLGFPIGDPAQ